MEYLKYLIIFIALLLFISLLVTCKQEKLIFYPEKLPKDFQFQFKNNFKDLFFEVGKNINLHGLLFKADSSKGLVFYLHGNAGSNRSWGSISDRYLENQYDFFVLDYRGYGKSDGKITGEKQLHSDIKHVYDSIKTMYDEKNIVILGFSIGSGPATYLAANNNPKKLILNAPYYNFPDLAHHYMRFVPSFLIRYKFMTSKNIVNVKCPIVIFHGDQDEVIYTGSSYKLQKLLKEEDKLIILEGQSHNGIEYNEKYRRELKNVLSD